MTTIPEQSANFLPGSAHPPPLKNYCPTSVKQKVYPFLARTYARLPGPMYQLWYGRPGEGKTHTLDGLLASLQVVAFHARPSDFESEFAGDPVRKLCEVYEEANKTLIGQHPEHSPDAEPVPAVIVVHDADRVFGRLPDTSYTVNYPVMLRALLNFADNPSRAFGRKMRRVPWILTANEPNLFPEAFVRDGRAEKHHWTLTRKNRIEMVRRHYQHFSEVDCDQLIDCFPSENIAFFADLSRAWENRKWMDAFWKADPVVALRDALRKRVWLKCKPPTIDQLILLGESILNDRPPVDVLNLEDAA